MRNRDRPQARAVLWLVAFIAATAFLVADFGPPGYVVVALLLVAALISSLILRRS